MFFVILTIVYSFIILIAIDGDYKSKELKKDIEDYKRITNANN